MCVHFIWWLHCFFQCCVHPFFSLPLITRDLRTFTPGSFTPGFVCCKAMQSQLPFWNPATAMVPVCCFKNPRAYLACCCGSLFSAVQPALIHPTMMCALICGEQNRMEFLWSSVLFVTNWMPMGLNEPNVIAAIWVLFWGRRKLVERFSFLCCYRCISPL